MSGVEWFIYEVFGVGHGGQPNTAYSFWSGFGACITEFAIVGALWHRLNCHVGGCWRLGHRKVPGTDHIVCHRHHPLPKPTHEAVLEDHRRHRPTGSRIS